MLEYKDYYAEIEYSAADKLLFGKISGIPDLVMFDADNANEIENSFHAAVDDYLEMCERIGKEPNKPYRGSFNVRITPELHRKAVRKANMQGLSLNEFVEKSIENALVEKTEYDEVIIKYKILYQTLLEERINSIYDADLFNKIPNKSEKKAFIPRWRSNYARA